MLTNYSSNLALPLPIPKAVLGLGQQFSRDISDAKKARQVQLNTMSVWVMQSYLQLMDIPSDLEQSDSWNPLLRILNDVADLRLPGLGQLECRPVERGETSAIVPPEVWQDRIGYCVIQIDESMQLAWLLGFVPTVNAEQLDLDRLRSPEALLEHLEQLRVSQRDPVSLRQWAQGIFAAGWELVETLLPPSRSDFAFRGESDAGERPSDLSAPDALQRAKRIELMGPPSVACEETPDPLVLILELRPTVSGSAVCVKVLPIVQATLPSNLQLAILDSAGELLIAAQSRLQDNVLQLQLEGDTGEEFTVLVTLEDARTTERFVI